MPPGPGGPFFIPGLIFWAIIIYMNISVIGSSINLVKNIQWNDNLIKDKCMIVDHLIKSKYEWDRWDACVILNVQNNNITKCLFDNWEYKRVEWNLQKRYPIGSYLNCYYQPNNANDVSFGLKETVSITLWIFFVILFDVIVLDIKLIFKEIYKLIMNNKWYSLFTIVSVILPFYFFGIDYLAERILPFN